MIKVKQMKKNSGKFIFAVQSTFDWTIRIPSPIKTKGRPNKGITKVMNLNSMHFF